MGLLDGKSAIIVGAAQGVGQAVAQLAVREGARVLAVDINSAGLEETARRVAADGGTLLTQSCDVTDRAQVDAAVAQAVATFGTVDMLVNTPLLFKPTPFHELTVEDFRGALDVMVIGVFNFMQAVFPHMRDGGGSIINCGSGGGTTGQSRSAAYATSKEAVRGLTKVAAMEWGRYGITVNCVVPAAKTPSADFAIEKAGPGALERFAAEHPMGRPFGDPLKDIAPIVIFLASQGGNYITARTIFVDGGHGGYK